MQTKAITLPKTITQVREYSLLCIAFLLPFLVSGPQLLTGTLVNTLLFLFAAESTSKKAILMIILPSIGALLNGILFGTFTVFLLYFIPFIWMGNYVLIHSFQALLKKSSFIIAVLGSSLLKGAVLFLPAYILTSFKIVPTIFLQFMGIFQLGTALVGGVIALGIYTIISHKK